MHAPHEGAEARQSHGDEEKRLKDGSKPLKARRKKQRDDVENKAHCRDEKLKIPELRTRRASGQCRVLQKAAGDGILKGQNGLPFKRSDGNAARTGVPGQVSRGHIRHFPGAFSRIRAGARDFSFRRHVAGRAPCVLHAEDASPAPSSRRCTRRSPALWLRSESERDA